MPLGRLIRRLFGAGPADALHPDSSRGKRAGGVVVMMRDVAERKKALYPRGAQAQTDRLTGLASRRGFDEALEREWRKTLKSGRMVSLLLLDLDRFRRFNDLFGHTAGDECLKAVSGAVQDGVRRPGGVVARYGGGAIAVILPEVALDGATEAAEEIRQSVATLDIPHPANKVGGGKVTVSVGVATALALGGGSIRMPDSLLMAAEGALYKAKQTGRNRVATALLVTDSWEGMAL
jgi:diguanylate cyclase (GGDEF)-like protein